MEFFDREDSTKTGNAKAKRVGFWRTVAFSHLRKWQQSFRGYQPPALSGLQAAVQKAT